MAKSITGVLIQTEGPLSTPNPYALTLTQSAKFSLENPAPYTGTEGVWPSNSTPANSTTFAANGAPTNSFNGVRMTVDTLHLHNFLPPDVTEASVSINIGIEHPDNHEFLVVQVRNGQPNTEVSIYSNFGEASRHLSGFLAVPLNSQADPSSLTMADLEAMGILQPVEKVQD